MSERIAVIGGGIAGLTAAYLLDRRYEVALFEKENRLGGNAYTLDTREGFSVDIAVAAFGKAGYKNFYKLLAQLGLKTSLCPDSYVSFHNLDTKTGLYFTPRPSALLAQRFELFKPANLHALLRLHMGLKKAQRMLASGELAGLTLEEALARIPEFSGYTRLMFLCTLCLLSSMTCADVLAAPAAFFVGKLKVHNDVISPRAVYSVRCVKGGTRRYVEALAEGFRDRVVLESRIRRVLRQENRIVLELEDGEQRAFDKVVFACNADQALALLESPTERERALLGAWRYTDGRLVVHRDHRAFPRRELMQAYTFLYTERGGKLQTSVNGDLRHEPGVPATCELISSQHPNFPIRPQLVEHETVLRTPIFDFASCRTIRELPSLNGIRNTYYCGSHFGHGLHDDAVTSAVAVARALGVEF